MQVFWLIQPIVRAIAEAVNQLHSNSTEYQILVEKGLARIKRYTWEKTAEQIAQIYEHLLGQTDIRAKAKALASVEPRT
jgi:glycosyltransferase involved in cell wall biosynthesis